MRAALSHVHLQIGCYEQEKEGLALCQPERLRCVFVVGSE